MLTAALNIATYRQMHLRHITDCVAQNRLRVRPRNDLISHNLT